MDRLIKISQAEDILPEYQNTPIGKLLEYHNLNKEYEEYEHAELLVGMCMDNREFLNIPKNFAYIMRTGGTNLYDLEFQTSYAIGVGGLKHIALTGHTDCGMSNLEAKREKFITGLVANAGWTRENAEKHFEELSPKFEIGDEIDYALEEVNYLRSKYPRIVVAPLMYKLNDSLLYLIKE